MPVSDSGSVGNAVIILGLPDGQYAAFPMVSKSVKPITRKHRKAVR